MKDWLAKDTPYPMWLLSWFTAFREVDDLALTQGGRAYRVAWPGAATGTVWVPAASERTSSASPADTTDNAANDQSSGS